MNTSKFQCQDILKTIFKCILNPIIVTDLEGKILEMNEAAMKFCQLPHFPAEENILNLSQKHGTECSNAISSFLGSNNSTKTENVVCRNRDGKENYISITSHPLKNDAGHLIGSIIIIYFLDSVDYIDISKSSHSYLGMVGFSSEMQYIFKLIDRLSKIDSTILITGETGTGKELIAEALHKAGNRADKPLVKVNCSALPDSLIESELFGSVKGAYTGASKDRIGRLQKADRGTLFLDEIGELSLSSQVKLLRFLQEKEFEKVGSSNTIKVDTRIIAATNKNLKQLVEEGKFRGDLFYRLNVFTINVPPLRKRREDIPILINYFVNYFSKKFKRKIFRISNEIMNFFNTYYWPGNIRELKHIIEYVAIMTMGDVVEPSDLPKDLHGYFKVSETNIDAEKDKILKALQKTRWNKSKAAQLLGISRRTLYRKLIKHSIA